MAPSSQDPALGTVDIGDIDDLVSPPIPPSPSLSWGPPRLAPPPPPSFYAAPNLHCPNDVTNILHALTVLPHVPYALHNTAGR
jgi:hypothetical protein